jgi:hypothetical protein
MKTLRRWWKKLCVGLAASAKERDITHGKVNKFGGTGMKVAAIVAVPLLLAEVGTAQTVITPGYSNGGYGSGNSYSFYPSGSSGGQFYTVYRDVNLDQTMAPWMRVMEGILKALSSDPYHGYGKRDGGNGGRPPSQQN